MFGRETCLGCGRVSPETNGDNTLTTSFGWRVRRAADEAGNGVVEWRCANCWQRWKASQAAPSSSDAPPMIATPVPTAPPASGAPTVVPTGVSAGAGPSRIPRGGNR